METISTQLLVNSPAFTDASSIPTRYCCDGENINPPLAIQDIPHGTQALALIMEDPDAPKGVFTHWLAWNITPHEPIKENFNPGISGTNSFGKTGYGGPCPPSGTHRYYFKLYALDRELDLPAGSDKAKLLEAMEGRILAQGELMGTYAKKVKTSL